MIAPPHPIVLASRVPRRPHGALQVGLISDTHGLLRPQALAALDGSDRIVHAGDVGAVRVVESLRALAPLTVVRGNNDRMAPLVHLPETAIVDLAGMRILVLHDLNALEFGATRDIAVVVSGHSHRPSSIARDGVLYVNPGSAGPRRFTLPVSVGLLFVRAGEVEAHLVQLAV